MSLPTSKPKPLKKMTQSQIDLYEEWDPSFLHTSPKPNPHQNKNQPNPLATDLGINIQQPQRPKPQFSSSFEEWKSQTTQNVPKENTIASELGSGVKSGSTNAGTSVAAISTTGSSTLPHVSPARNTVPVPGQKKSILRRGDGPGHRKPGSTSSVGSTSSPKTPFSPAKVNPRRNVKTHSSSMIPVYSPRRDDLSGVVGVRGEGRSVEDQDPFGPVGRRGTVASVPVGGIAGSTGMPDLPGLRVEMLPRASTSTGYVPGIVGQMDLASLPVSAGINVPGPIGQEVQPSQPLETGGHAYNPEAPIFLPKPTPVDTHANSSMNPAPGLPTQTPDKTTGSIKQPRRRPERRGYTAPNGTFLSNEELHRLSAGVKLENNDTVYFRLNFLSDPWENLKAKETTFLKRW